MQATSILSDSIKSGGQLFLAKVAVGLFAAVNIGILARLLPQEMLALIPVALSLGSIVQLVTSLGLPATCVLVIPELLARADDEQAGAYLRTTLALTVVLILPLLAVIALKAGWLARLFLKSPNFDGAILQMLPLVFLTAVALNLNLLMQGVSEFRRLSVILVMANLTQQLLILPAYFLGGISLVLLLALPLGPLLQIVLFMRTLGKLIFRNRKFHPPLALIKFSLNLYGYSFVCYGGVDADQLLVALLFSPSQLAIYYVGKKFSQILFHLLNSMSTTLLPKIAWAKTRGRKDLNELFAAATRYFGFIALPACLGLAAISLPVIQLMAGSAYRSAGWILIVQSLAMLAYAFYTLYRQNAFYAAGARGLLWLETINGTVTIGAGVLLGLHFGIIGFAAGTLLGYLGATYPAIRLAQRLFDPQVDWQAIRRVALAMIVPLGFAVLPQMVGWSLEVTWIFAGIGALIFLSTFIIMLETPDVEVLSQLAPAKLSLLIVKGADAVKLCLHRTRFFN